MIDSRAQVFELKLRIALETGIPPSVQGLCVGAKRLRDYQRIPAELFEEGAPATPVRLVRSSGGHASADYMKNQAHINGPIRAILVEWMIELTKETRRSPAKEDS